MSIYVDQAFAIRRYLEIDEQQIPVTEEVYRAYKRPAWTEKKRKEREKRCRDENGNRCTGDCSKCDKQQTGSVLSLSRLNEDLGYEPAGSVDVAEMVADSLLLKELFAALEELDPENRKIMVLFCNGETERGIAAAMGLSQKAINKRKAKLFAQLRERFKDFF